MSIMKSAWLLFIAKLAILLVIYYDGENKLDFDEMMKMSALYSLS